MSNLVPATVKYVLEKFAQSNLNYAVLRNYEKLPEIGHDLDLVTAKDQLPQIRTVLAEAAAKLQWECLVEYPHYRSFIYIYNICVFKFYNLQTGDFLQIDLFGGFSIWAADAMSADELLQRRTKQDFYYKIDYYDELIMRAMQLGCAIRDGEPARVTKLKGYLERVTSAELIDAFVQRTKCKIAPKFLLFIADNVKYCKYWNHYKKQYLFSFILHKPIYVGWRMLMRSWYLLKLNFFYNPGLLLCFNFREKSNIKAELQASDKFLRQHNFVQNFIIADTINLNMVAKLLQAKKSGSVAIFFSRFCTRCNALTNSDILTRLMAKGIVLFHK